MLGLFIYLLFCLAVTTVATWRYRSLTKNNHVLSRTPVEWFISFIVAIVGNIYYFFGSVPSPYIFPLLLFSGVAAILAISGYSLHLLYKNNEPSFVGNVIDFTLFGMQRLLGTYVIFVALLIIGWTQSTLPHDTVFIFLGVLWVGLGAIYGSVHALHTLKIGFD